MSISYVRCRYTDPEGRECGNFHGVHDDEEKPFCPIHSGILGPRSASISPQIKEDYVNETNAERLFTLSLYDPSNATDFEKIDAHIAMLEGEIAKLKIKASAGRAVKSEILQKLSEEERAALRKIKTPKVSNGAVKKSAAAPVDPIAKMASTILKQREMMGKPISADEAVKIAKSVMGM